MHAVIQLRFFHKPYSPRRTSRRASSEATLVCAAIPPLPTTQRKSYSKQKTFDLNQVRGAAHCSMMRAEECRGFSAITRAILDGCASKRQPRRSIQWTTSSNKNASDQRLCQGQL
jgi:hypothetical protein